MIIDEETVDVLAHYGKKGMKWGVRRAAKKTAKADKKFAQGANDFRNTLKIHNTAAERANKEDVPRINNKPAYKDKDFTRDTPLRRKYYKEHQDAFLNQVVKAADEFGTNASGTKKYGVHENSDGTWNLVLKDVKHADDSEFIIQPTFDKLGHILNLTILKDSVEHGIDFANDFLEHYGKKGMKWGVRNTSRTSGVSRRTDRTAKKDAKEFARAKMFYGEGAGTRRKLIKNTVEARSKKDPLYEKAFDKHLKDQDMSTHASKARSERSRKNKAETAKKGAAATARRITGEPGNVAAIVGVSALGIAYLNSPKGRATMNKSFSTIKNVGASQRNQKIMNDLFKKM